MDSPQEPSPQQPQHTSRIASVLHPNNRNCNSPAPTTRITVAQVIECHQYLNSIRNVCVLAHVDHGKTTLTDSLIASNGLISQRLAGSIRWLDSLPAEQEREITMESSAISLLYDFPNSGKGDSFRNRYMIQLLDSPGHVDFEGQVESASELCENCLILIDVVEEICSQTIALMRHAHQRKLTPILVLNKIDRLILELQFSPQEITKHLIRLIEKANAVWAMVEGITTDFPLSLDELSLEDRGASKFCAETGNVVFASAIDGWSFSIPRMALFLSEKMGMSIAALGKSLWGEFYYHPREKKIFSRKGAEKAGLPTEGKTLFTTLVIDPIWKLYQVVFIKQDNDMLRNMLKKLGVAMTDREIKLLALPTDGDFRPNTSRRMTIKRLFSSWIPLSAAIFQSIIKIGTCPKVNKPEHNGFSIIDVSKLFLIKHQSLVSASEVSISISELNETLVGLSQLKSGSLKIGDKLQLISSGPKCNLDKKESYKEEFEVSSLFIPMGRDLFPIEEVHPGIIFVLGPPVGEILSKRGRFIVKNTKEPSFYLSHLISHSIPPSLPLVRVAIEPLETIHLQPLIHALIKLHNVDPVAVVKSAEEGTGEIILYTAGEVHLEECLRDLSERYAPGIKFITSTPMVPFRETIAKENSNDNESPCLNVLMSPIYPPDIIPWLYDEYRNNDSFIEDPETSSIKLRIQIDSNVSFTAVLKAFLINAPIRKDSSNVFELTLGGTVVKAAPKYSPQNLLMISRKVAESPQIWSLIHSSVINGFEIAVEAGPLCKEPLYNICFFIDEINLEQQEEAFFDPPQFLSIISGRLITCIKELCHRVFLRSSPRLMLAYYDVSIQTNSEMLGKVYSVLGKRSGIVNGEEYNESTGNWNIHGLLPITTSFGFAQELRSKTSGSAFPQLTFHGFKTLESDPFQKTSSTDEGDSDPADIEDHSKDRPGEDEDFCSIAMVYVNEVREKKGLPTTKRLIRWAEKQRTLTKK